MKPKEAKSRQKKKTANAIEYFTESEAPLPFPTVLKTALVPIKAKAENKMMLA